MGNARSYLSTHPWINFTLDLSGDIPYELWLLLGAAESKCRHLAGIPLRPEKQEELNAISLRKGVHATTAIEGNSLSEEEVQRIIDHPDREFPESKQYQKREVQNVLRAFNDIAEEAKEAESRRVGPDSLARDNLAMLDGLNPEGVTPGEIRTCSVVVNSYRGAPAEDCGYLLERLFRWLDESWGLGDGHEFIEGILKAITAHLYVAWIHPFGDGNGRCARMLEFRLLTAAGVPPTAAHLLTSHYNDTRMEYYIALSQTSGTPQGDPVPFLLYALQGLVDALDGRIAVILDEQLDAAWKNYVRESVFGGKLSDAQTRQRDLLIKLSAFDRAIPLNEFKQSLSDETLARYEGKTPQTLNRDINTLIGMNEVEKTGNSVRALKEKMKAFLPIRK